MATFKQKSDTGIDKIIALDQFVLEGAQRAFTKVFNIPTMWATSDDGVHLIQRLYNEKNIRDVYPFMLLSLDAWNVVEEKRNQRDASMRGVKISPSTDLKSLMRSKIVPIEYSISIDFRTNSWSSLLSFARYWMFYSITRDLNFQVDYGLTPIDIRVELNKSFQFPKRESSPEAVQEYTATNTLTISNYVNVPELYQQGVIDTVEVSAEVPSTDGSANTQVWSLRSPKII